MTDVISSQSYVTYQDLFLFVLVVIFSVSFVFACVEFIIFVKDHKNKNKKDNTQNDVVSRALYDYKVKELNRLYSCYNDLHIENDKHLKELNDLCDAWVYFSKAFYDFDDNKIDRNELRYAFNCFELFIDPASVNEGIED